MKKWNTVVLMGGEELTAEGNISALETAGCYVISTDKFDYALAANELFEPRALVLDADHINGDFGTFCNTLVAQRHIPAIHIIGNDDALNAGLNLPTEHIGYIQKPISAADLVSYVKAEGKRAPVIQLVQPTTDTSVTGRMRRKLRGQQLATLGIAAAAVVVIGFTTMLALFSPLSDILHIDAGQSYIAAPNGADSYNSILILPEYEVPLAGYQPQEIRARYNTWVIPAAIGIGVAGCATTMLVFNKKK